MVDPEGRRGGVWIRWCHLWWIQRPDVGTSEQRWWQRVDGLDGPMDGLGELVHGFVFTFVFPDSFSQVSKFVCENIDFRKWALRLPL